MVEGDCEFGAAAATVLPRAWGSGVTVAVPCAIDDAATPSQYAVHEGDPVEMHCRASGVPAPLITWRREDGVPVANGLSLPDGLPVSIEYVTYKR